MITVKGLLNITEHSEQELSLLVFNDEDLYRRRHQKDFMVLINETFEYTAEQLKTLKEDLEEDSEELNNETE